LSKKEREELAKQDRESEENAGAEVKDDGESSKVKEDNPEWYIAHDEKGAYCKACGLPLLPDPEPRMLEIWLHAIRYRESESFNSGRAVLLSSVIDN
jgi:hypothetical protein